MNNHLVGKTDILKPRAKIGDVVILKDYQIWAGGGFSGKWVSESNTKVNKIFQKVVVDAVYDQMNREPKWVYYWRDACSIRCFDKDILKNLTTNVSYE